MTKNMQLGMAFHPIVRKNRVENVSGVGSGTCHERKVHRRKHMDHHMILDGTGSESDIHHRETVMAMIRQKKNQKSELLEVITDLIKDVRSRMSGCF